MPFSLIGCTNTMLPVSKSCATNSIAEVFEYLCDCAVNEAALFVEVAREPDQETLHGNDPQL